MNLSRNALTAALLAASALPAPVRAQTSDAPEQPSGGISDIVVTARKTAERAQDVPISLTVATGETLTNRSVRNFIDLQQQTPAMHVVPAAISATSSNVAMRGQSTNDIRLNVDPAIVIYLDGVALPRLQGSNAADLLDVERVEILSGPQGTLFGKNSTGGAVSISNRDPVQTSEGFVKARMGSYLDSSIAGMINVPLSDTLAFRTVASYSHNDGYGRNLLTTNKTGQRDIVTVRAALKYDPGDALMVTVRGDYTHAKVTREAFKSFQYLAPINPTAGTGPSVTTEAALELFNLPNLAAFNAQSVGTRVSQLTAAEAALRGYAQGDPDDYSSNLDPREKAKIWGISGQIDYELSDNVSLKSITAYRGFARRASADLDGTPFSIIEYPFQHTNDKQFSQEAQINVTGFDRRLKWITGVYYANETGTEEIRLTSVARVSGAAAATGIAFADVGNKTMGVFSQASFKFTDQFSATGGIRYTKDKRRLDAQNYNQTMCTSLGVTLASIGGVDACHRPMRTSFSEISYTASLEYHPVRDIMLYAKTSRGYRAGGLQQAANGGSVALANAAFQPFQPEIVTDYEGGIKSELLDRHLRVNASYFHMKLNNAIRNVAVPVPGETRFSTRAQNAATAKIDGVEFDITAVPVDGLELSANGAYTDARFVSYITPTGEDRTNIPLTFTPRWQLGGTVAYTADLGWGDWRNQVDVSYTGRQLASEVSAYSPAHTLWNFRSSVDIKDADLNLAVYVKNLTNRRYIVFPTEVASLGFIYDGMYNPSRIIGVEATKKF
jgi:iron complex outermembrane receptor protein